MFLKQIYILYISERRVLGIGGGGLEMGSSIFLRRMERLNRRYLPVLGLASGGFLESYLASKLAIEVGRVLRE